ncbi:hypothetical protein CERSUDRAFT_77508 [Gelatoporia subvermispora B]|uniref:Uncharacterized protein n=1 Tax=Ceriporiopsis subvermispora (strain B) TaxID=914234 RepID=M2R1R3_CERS8|nr:hypothetical protein CERSUDRAFT_77508 [Gelatoporia subvermispora B]
MRRSPPSLGGMRLQEYDTHLEGTPATALSLFQVIPRVVHSTNGMIAAGGKMRAHPDMPWALRGVRLVFATIDEMYAMESQEHDAHLERSPVTARVAGEWNGVQSIAGGGDSWTNEVTDIVGTSGRDMRAGDGRKGSTSVSSRCPNGRGGTHQLSVPQQHVNSATELAQSRVFCDGFLCSTSRMRRVRASRRRRGGEGADGDEWAGRKGQARRSGRVENGKQKKRDGRRSARDEHDKLVAAVVGNGAGRKKEEISLVCDEQQSALALATRESSFASGEPASGPDPIQTFPVTWLPRVPPHPPFPSQHARWRHARPQAPRACERSACLRVRDDLFWRASPEARARARAFRGRRMARTFSTCEFDVDQVANDTSALPSQGGDVGLVGLPRTLNSIAKIPRALLGLPFSFPALTGLVSLWVTHLFYKVSVVYDDIISALGNSCLSRMCCPTSTGSLKHRSGPENMIPKVSSCLERLLVS